MDARKKMILHSYRVRGQVLQFAIELEIRIEDYIAKHLTIDNEKQTELIGLILAPRVTFESKFQTFQFLINKYHPEFKDKAPNYKTHLTDIIKNRNTFAHYPAVFTEETQKEFEKDGSLSFYKIINQKQHLIFKISMSLVETNKFLNLMRSYSN